MTDTTGPLAPTVDIRRAGDRFKTRLTWLDSKHCFSFSRHYDPLNTHHGLLLVNNDDVVRPGTGFEQAVGSLPGYVAEAVRGGRIRAAAMDPVDLSSTEIRSKIGAGLSISTLVSPPVAQYIQRYGLYRPGG